MSKDLWIISSEKTRVSDERIARFAEFMGIEHQFVCLDNDCAHDSELPIGGSFSIAEANLTQTIGNGRLKTAIANARHVFCYCDREHAEHPPGLMAAVNRNITIEKLPAGTKKCRIERLDAFGNFPVSNQSFDFESAGGQIAFKKVPD